MSHTYSEVLKCIDHTQYSNLSLAMSFVAIFIVIFMTICSISEEINLPVNDAQTKVMCRNVSNWGYWGIWYWGTGVFAFKRQE